MRSLCPRSLKEGPRAAPIAARVAGGLAALALVTFLPACDTAGTSGGTLDDLAPLALTEERRLGDFDDPDVGFSRVSALEVGSDGLIYVTEGSVPEIRVYDGEDRVVRRIGRQGEGPGEFQFPASFGVVGDTVWAWDQRLRRITLFDREGRVLSTARVEPVQVALPAGYASVLPWRMRPDGRFTSRASMVGGLRPDDPPTGVRPTDSIPVPLVLFDTRGQVTDTIGWAGRPPPRLWRPPSEDDFRMEFVHVGEQRYMVPNPPTTLPFWESLHDGYILVETPVATSADQGTITVTRMGLHGDTVYSRALPYRPRPYTAAELDSVGARAARGAPGGGVPFSPGQEAEPPNVDQVTRALRTAMDFPDFQLPVVSTWLAQDETLWLRLTGGADGEPVGWVLIDAAGEPRGRLELPPLVRPLWARGDTVWVVEPGEFDVPWVVRYRLEEG